MKILVVEDEPKIAGFLSRGLDEEGHRVTVAGTVDQAHKVLADRAFDVWIVDRMLPDGDGLEVIRARRLAGDQTPALCLTARDRVDERVEGLLGGADDYLIKPFAFDELLARIEVLRRRAGTPPATLRVGDLHLDSEAHRVTRGGREIPLTTQEFALLRFLMEHKGRVMSRSALLEGVWDVHRDPGTNVVDVYIRYLRNKVDKDFALPLIHSVRGVGYVIEDRPR